MYAMTDPQTLRTVSEQLATEAATFVQTRRAEVFGATPVQGAVEAKSTPTDPVTVVDKETGQEIRVLKTHCVNKHNIADRHNGFA